MVELHSLWVLKRPVQLVGKWKVTARFPVEGPSGDFFDVVGVTYIRTASRGEYFANVTKYYTSSAFLLLFNEDLMEQ